jgi:hypothetical protein
MNFASAIAEINWISVVIATVAAFAIGGLWYSPVLFGKAWQTEIKLSTDDLRKTNMAMIFGLSFVLNFISAVVLEMFIGKNSTMTFGLIAGLLVGIAWIATSLGVNYLFARKSFRLFLIDAFYFIVYFAVMGVILGAW